MARMRSLKPEFWLDRKLARSLSRDERMLYLALWNQADEWARAQADPRLVKGQTFPYDDDVTLDVIDAWMDALEGAGVLQRYEVDGDPYLFLPKLSKHQRLEPSKVPSRFPEPPPFDPDQQFRPRANESARDLDESAPRANELSLKHVACSREHEAGQPRADKSAAAPDGFDEFWAAYPKKAAKPAARKAWRSAVKRADVATIMAGLSRYKPDPQFIANPSTWLNNDRWADEPAQGTLSLLRPSGDGFTAAELDQILGPAPGMPQPPRGLDGDQLWEWDQRTRREIRAERVRQANAKLGRVTA